VYTIKRLFVALYWEEVTDILVTFVASLGIGIFLQAVKYGIGYFVMTPEQAEVIVYKVFDVLSIPFALSMLLSTFTFIIKGLKQAFTE
jgi:hypothetical protein